MTNSLGPDDRDLVGLNVLMVDDEPTALRLVQGILYDTGAAVVTTASDGREALQFLASCETLPDVIICDWSMPRMSGLELLRLVRARHPDLPFLMLTGSADLASVVEAKQNGVSGYIRKPFTRDELLKKMRVVARIKSFRAPQRFAS